MVRSGSVAVALVVGLGSGATLLGQPAPQADPACATESAKACLALAVAAMGGATKLNALQRVHYLSVGHEVIPEQSYRQDPFITAYLRSDLTIDYEGQRASQVAQRIWPETDGPDFERTSTLIVSPAGGVHRSPRGDTPAGIPEVEALRLAMSLGPGRLLATAERATDLQYGAPELLRSTRHTVLRFRWNDTPVKILINPFNHLPDAVELTTQPGDFWFYWGDVERRFYFDNWVVFDGLVWPTNVIEERNGLLRHSEQVLTLQVNPTVDETTWKLDPAVAQKAYAWFGTTTLDPSKAKDLAPGLTLFTGGWNTTLVELPDGVDILEAPISPEYVDSVVAEARRRFPAKPVRAVVSTSDSWPHVGGIRGAVALGLPTYILDLNEPLLDRLVKAPHTLHPDRLATAPRSPAWKVVTGRTLLGTGDNRMELYPLHGASTERQMMVYFPAHRLLYASDTLAINQNGALYDPELMREVAEAVRREHLQVDTVYAMHSEPIAWTKVTAWVDAAMK